MPIKFCTPPMIYKNEQLLFFDQHFLRPNQTSGSRFVFLQNPSFQTLAGCSLIAEGLPDSQIVPQSPLTFYLNCKHIILVVVYYKFGELFVLKMSGHLVHPFFNRNFYFMGNGKILSRKKLSKKVVF